MHPPKAERGPQRQGPRSENDQLGRQIGSEKYNAPITSATALKVTIVDAHSYGQISELAAIALIRVFGLEAA